MSIIPKIKVGMPKKRERLNLSFDNSTTANIGSIQPTMCREMVPNETFNVKVASLARLSPLVKPTFGRMSLRHYHAFVPYKDIWEPFESMLSGQHYSNNGTTYIPTACPYFTMDAITQLIIMNYSEVTIYEGYEIDADHAITFDPIGMTTAEAQTYVSETLTPAWNALKQNQCFGLSGTNYFRFNNQGIGGLSDSARGYVNFGGWYFTGAYDDSIVFSPQGNATNIIPFGNNGGGIVTADGADYISSYGGYTFCFKLRPVAKRFRQVMIGLGYQFSPYSNVQFNPFKLIAYYKVWFELFRPTRQMSFQDTNCYKLIMAMRDASYNGANLSPTLPPVSTTNYNTFHKFIVDLSKDCYYYLPMDYFSMATIQPFQSNSDETFTIKSPLGKTHQNYGDSVVEGFATDGKLGNLTYGWDFPKGTPSQSDLNGTTLYSSVSPLVMKMAMRLLTFANKNSVVGRSVRQWLKVHYGIDGGQELDGNGVSIIGSSRTNIQISDVMSTAETANGDTGGVLGEYAGKGIGYGDSEKFDYTAKYFGVWLTLTVVVPESGYFQGYLLENRHSNRYQFFMPEFDALGYQILERGELIDDYNCDGESWKPRTGFNRTEGFGVVPRYSEYKVGRNVVNGDLSLPGMYSENSPYTLDRRLPAGAYTVTSPVINFDDDEKITAVWNSYRIVEPGFVPNTVYDEFRRIDPTDHLGQYNRIFYYQRNDVDHFILHFVFDVEAIAPMKSLTSSFDTIQEDDKVIDVTHS